MRTRKRKLFAILLVLIATVLTLFVTVQTADVAPPYLEGETGSFRYTAQGERDGGLYVVVSVNLDDPIALQKYITANRQRGRSLANKGQSPIPIRLTFVRPLPLDEARTLVRETELHVTSFAMVGHSSLNGRKGFHVEFSSMDKDVPLRRNIDPTGQGEELALRGVMVVYGEIRNPQGLTRLLDDPRIYLADTSEVEVRELLAQRHASAVTGKELVVSVPSPFWNMDW